MDAIKPPGPLKLCGNMNANWRTFKQQFELYVVAIGQAAAVDERKIALLLTIAGADAVEVYNADSLISSRLNHLHLISDGAAAVSRLSFSFLVSTGYITLTFAMIGGIWITMNQAEFTSSVMLPGD